MRSCPVCSHSFPNFLPLAASYFETSNQLHSAFSLDDFETLNLGQYLCPDCGASDRDRLYALFIQCELHQPSGKHLRILEIAPAPALSRLLRALPASSYRSADLCSPLADDHIDIMDMHIYEDESFDFVVCSHVLEHVRDDLQAMRELHRILSPAGLAILMVPILLTASHTDEDPNESDPQARIRRFGQNDHVRLYSRHDFLERLQSAGFVVEQWTQADFPAGSHARGLFRQHGINEGAVLYVGRKSAPLEANRKHSLTKITPAALPQSADGHKAGTTIVIPAYKSKYFEAALRSAIGQTARSLEILVSDDSPDESIRDIVTRHRATSVIPIRYIRNTQALGEAKNLAQCIALAQGEFIKPLYDDDLLAPECVEQLSAVLSRRPDISLASSRRGLIGPDGEAMARPLPYRFPFDRSSILDGKDVTAFLSNHTINFIGEPSSVMFRRAQALAWVETGIFVIGDEDIQWVGDLALYVKLLQLGELAMLEDELSSFRVSPEQYSQLSRDNPNVGSGGHAAFKRKVREMGWHREIGKVQICSLHAPTSVEAFDLYGRLSQLQAETAAEQARTSSPEQLAYQSWVAGGRTLENPQASKHLDHFRRFIHFTVCIRIQGNDARRARTRGSLARQLRPADSVLEIRPEAPWLSEAATYGGWTLLLCEGDLLEADALLLLEHQLAKVDQAVSCFAYFDHDEVGTDGTLQNPQFKPAFNHDLLLSLPYHGRAVAIRTDWARAHLQTSTFPQSALELAYRLALQALAYQGPAAFVRIPALLAHLDVSVPALYADTTSDWQQLASLVAAHLEHTAPGAQVLEGPGSGTFHRIYPLVRTPLVSIVIPTRDQLPFLSRCVESLLDKTAYPNFEILIVDNDSQTAEAREYLHGLAQLAPERIRVLAAPGPFNFSRMNNQAAREARGEFLLLLNNDTAALQADWLEHMVRNALREDVGIVGARLLYPDGRLQHAGVIMGLRGPAEHPLLGLDPKAPGYMFRAQVQQNFSAVTAACLLVSKDLYEAVGGLDESSFGVSYNDVDFCLRVRQTGKLIVWTPLATLLHEGSASQKASIEAATHEMKAARFGREQAAMYQRWPEVIANDPAYNPNLSLAEHGYEIETNPVLRFDKLKGLTEKRVLAFAADDHGCGQYRMIQPILAMLDAGLCTGGTSPEILWPNLALRSGANTLVFQRPVDNRALDALESLIPLKGIKKIFEIDDNLSRVPLKSAHYKHMPKDLRGRINKAISLCDRLVVSTEALAHELQGKCADTRVVMNRLPPAMWGKTPPGSPQALATPSRKPRVGWAGGVSHQGDLEMIADVIRDLSKEVDWVFFGMCPDALRPYVAEFHSGVPTMEYSRKLMQMAQGWDLAIAPLELNAFNECKSNLKLLEYGWCGVPVVCSDITPYQGDLPATLVKNRYRDWRDAIMNHVNDREASRKQGLALQAKVAADWTLTGQNLQDWYHAWTD